MRAKQKRGGARLHNRTAAVEPERDAQQLQAHTHTHTYERLTASLKPGPQQLCHLREAMIAVGQLDHQFPWFSFVLDESDAQM